MSRFLLIAGISDSLISFRGALIDELLERFDEVHVAVPDPHSSPGVVSALLARGVLIHQLNASRTGMNPVSDVFSFFSYLAVCRRVRPECMLAYTAKAIIYGCLAARFCGIQHRFALVTGLGFVFQRHGSLRKRLAAYGAKILYRQALIGAKRAIFQNQDDMAEMLERGVLDPGAPVSVVRGSGVDCSHFRPVPLPEMPSFLMISRLLNQKGVREYVEAAEIVKASHPEASFALLGWRDDNPDAVSVDELQFWKKEGCVSFHDKTDDVRPFLAKCSVFVLPSYREGTPRTVLEAMAMGRAIITSDAPGCRDTVQHGENGVLVEPRSVEELAAAMQSLAETPELVRDMGCRSRARAERLYEVTKVNSQMLKAMGLLEEGVDGRQLGTVDG